VKVPCQICYARHLQASNRMKSLTLRSVQARISHCQIGRTCSAACRQLAYRKQRVCLDAAP
jgi:hypothetical protein